ncbi:T9SS type A sorting domain-containing protein [Winogradskyella sp.]|uniref:T9SS type A sorting domain-containing protein n=1 Tax=Winogradskyella sp. TaxID=1883156 RepID=UPI0035C85D65
MKKITLFILFILTLNFNSYSQSPCDYSVTLNDSYGDGWNGASINILVDNVETLSGITVATGYDETFSIPNVADGAVITSEIVSLGTYPGEITWDIKNNIGSIVDSGDGSPEINVNIAVACQTPIVPPTNISSSTATLINCGETLLTNSLGSTATPEDVGCTMSDLGVWYTFVGTGLDVTVTSTASFDQELAIASGTPSALVNEVCVDSGFTSETATISTTLGTNYYIYTAHWGSSNSTGEISVNLECATCTPPTVVATVVNDCDVSGGFLIDLDVTSLGNATSLQFYDGTTFVTVTTTGTVQYGPYTNGTLVDFQIDHDSDSSCNLFATGLTQLACPPANDECSGAIALSNDGTVVSGTTAAATGAGGAMSCNGSIGNNVWYTLTGDGGDITVNVVAANEGAQVGIYESSDGSCSGFTEGTCIASVDDLGALITEVTFTSTIGTVYYVNLGAWISSGDDFPFTVSATSTALSNDDFGNLAAFTYYPNPVNNILTLDAQKNIESIVAYNMLGQEVLRLSPNTVNAEVDMSSLLSGAYFVKVSIQGATKTVRIIKQ